jgi:hypothetical protein
MLQIQDTEGKEAGVSESYYHGYQPKRCFPLWEKNGRKKCKIKRYYNLGEGYL